MSLSDQEKMNILLQQIQLPDEINYEFFKAGKLNKISVFKKEKHMIFNIGIVKTLPFQVFMKFKQNIDQAFAHIATTEVYFEVEDASCSEEDYLLYWHYFIEKSDNILPNHKKRMNSHCMINEALIEIEMISDVESMMLEKKVTKLFKDFTNQLGLPMRQIKVITNTRDNNKEDFQKWREAENESLRQSQEAIQVHQEKNARKEKPVQTAFAYGYQVKDEPVLMETIVDEEKRVTVEGYVFTHEVRKLRSERSLLIMKITDYSDSLEIKVFSRDQEDALLFDNVSDGMWIRATGKIQLDTYSNQLAMMANAIQEVPKKVHEDTYEEKRVELHAHTTMSQLDAVVTPSRLIEQAKAWGHDAIAITDHAGVQGFPEAYNAARKLDMKIIYGVEANVVDDGIPIAYQARDLILSEGTYVVFDVETTGLSSAYDTIIELAGVKIKDGEIIDSFESFANPHRPLPEKIIEITNITDDMLIDAPEVDKVLQDFYAWAEESVLVAHNATFDIGFLNQGYHKIGLPKVDNTVIDTLQLARFLFPQLGNHRLNTLCKHVKVELTQHHRAIYDAEATGKMFLKMVDNLHEQEITNVNQLNDHMGEGDSYQHGRPFHAILLVKNGQGLKNLYRLVSEAHTKYFYRVPRIPRSLLEKYREGLLIGSACDQGEVFDALMSKTIDEVEEIADFYDYLEVQPPSNYLHLIDRELIQNEMQIREIIENIIALGQKMDKPVVATSNSHYIEEHEKLYRKILIASQKGNPLNRVTLPSTPFRTTNEMFDAFSFLDESKAYEIIIKNTNLINDSIESVAPLKKDLYTPSIEGAEEDVRRLTYETAKAIYGSPLPEIIEKRIEKELDSIIGNGFAVIYLISHKLVKKSLDDGYLVGSRGSVGSSLVATLTEITEVNPMPAHYVCPNCHYSEFITDGSYASGFDLPDKDCPECQHTLTKDGQDIPFETFLGFKGDKVPDIDLNFSGDYQPRAHNYTKELFGEDYVFRAGTIGTIAEKTAYGYVKGYASDHNLHMKGAEIDRLVKGCSGVKRTTGQHPGGIVVVPNDEDIYEFTPIQYPADDRKSEWHTTHFDYRSIEDNLLKLDILGHDDPTVIRKLQDLSGIDPKTIPLDDKEVMKIFSSTESIGVTPEQIDCRTGTFGVPEFGTSFVRQMLEDTKPTSFAELVIISGLSHGTDVWLGNAQELINNKICEIGDVIGCRDDIMVYLMQKGLEASLSFKIMESVRKGKGLQDEWVVTMKENGVPDWYIDSCRKIKYMFPKAHASAYVLMAVRIAYFKVHYPLYFYAAYFSIRASDFELDTMIQGSNGLRNRIQEIKQKGNDAAPKEKTLLTVLEVSLEMCERGFHFKKVDLYRSSATEFIIDGDALLPPFNVIEGLGTNAAISIVKAREQGEFLSKEDLRERSRISKTVLQYLDEHGSLEGMEDENQLSLF